MSRFATLADSITGVATVGPVGFKDLSLGSRIHVQFVSLNGDPFSIRALGTLDYDFALNLGLNYFDMTVGLTSNMDDDDIGLFLTNGKFQHRKKPKGVSITSEGVYAFDSDFIPASLIFLVDSVTSGDNLKIILGV